MKNDVSTGVEQRNFLALLMQGITRRVSYELSSDKFVLPFLFAALGGPMTFSGLFTSIMVIGRLVAQLAGARLAGISTHQGGWLGCFLRPILRPITP